MRRQLQGLASLRAASGLVAPRGRDDGRGGRRRLWSVRQVVVAAFSGSPAAIGRTRNGAAAAMMERAVRLQAPFLRSLGTAHGRHRPARTFMCSASGSALIYKPVRARGLKASSPMHAALRDRMQAEGFELMDAASYALMGKETHPLEALFNAKHILVVGATDRPGTLGASVMQNLLKDRGLMSAVNTAPLDETGEQTQLNHPELTLVAHSRRTVHGISTYASVEDAPGEQDLALILNRAELAVQVVRDLIKHKPSVRCAVLYGQDFDESDTVSGKSYIAQIDELVAMQPSLRLLGPHSSGVLSTAASSRAPFSALFAPIINVRPGGLALLTNSGALMCALMDWSVREQFGFSRIVSLGRMRDLDWSDTIGFLGNDPATRAIIVHMEGIGDVRSFISAAREVALRKPIIVLKSLVYAETRAAVRFLSDEEHGTNAIDNDVLSEIFRRTGVLRVSKIDELFLSARALATQPVPEGPRLGIVTNAGGPGLVAVDALLSGSGKLAKLSSTTSEFLARALPPGSSTKSLVDISWEGDVENPHIYHDAVSAALRDENTDAVLVVLSPQANTRPIQAAHEVAALAPEAQALHKTLLASWMGGSNLLDAHAVLRRAGIPNFAFVDAAVRIFNYLVDYKLALRNLYEVPDSSSSANATASGTAAGRVTKWKDAAVRCRKTIQQIQAATQHGSEIELGYADAAKVLGSYGIPCLRTAIVESMDEAVIIAAEMRLPVSLTITRGERAGDGASSGAFGAFATGGETTYYCDSTDAIRRVFRSVVEPEAVRITLSPASGCLSEPNFGSQSGGRGALPAAPGGARAPRGVTVALKKAIVRDEDRSNMERSIFKLVLTSRIEPHVGPVLVVGSRGIFSQDRALLLPPLSIPLARLGMDRTAVYSHMCDVESPNRHILENIVVQMSRLVTEQCVLSSHLELHVSPALVAVTDASMRISPAGAPPPRCAIRPYPTEYPYFSLWPGDSMGTAPVMMRIIRPEDEPLVRRFVEQVTGRAEPTVHSESDDSWVGDRIANLCHSDYATKLTLLAEARNRDSGMVDIVAMGTLIIDPRLRRGMDRDKNARSEPQSREGTEASGARATNAPASGTQATPAHDALPSPLASQVASVPPQLLEKNFSVIVHSSDRSPGLRIELLRRMVQIAREESIPRLVGIISEENGLLLRTCKMVGFRLEPIPGSHGKVRVEFSVKAK
ncbi:Acetate--CoA ligase ADP-forming I [Porphyridium purpureum]|uniref:Acetate--CoA ligase ADP-forming I n=1 Tax=Porphyridium purpureum TaxID=35688 RepID=A0A5J4Z3G9_PORPP|nr:Acetate--CoA ligase ADP-forming I [Porphyridium purpureum]|eukprot:POR9864..scf295_1